MFRWLIGFAKNTSHMLGCGADTSIYGGMERITAMADEASAHMIAASQSNNEFLDQNQCKAVQYRQMALQAMGDRNPSLAAKYLRMSKHIEAYVESEVDSKMQMELMSMEATGAAQTVRTTMHLAQGSRMLNSLLSHKECDPDHITDVNEEVENVMDKAHEIRTAAGATTITDQYGTDEDLVQELELEMESGEPLPTITLPPRPIITGAGPSKPGIGRDASRLKELGVPDWAVQYCQKAPTPPSGLPHAVSGNANSQTNGRIALSQY
jgi:hypothetical protein